MKDTVLDWEDPLPASELDKAQSHSRSVVFITDTF